MKLVIDVKVGDLERATKFYTEVLGLTYRTHGEGWVAVEVGGAEIHLYKDGGVTGNVEFYVEDIDTKVAALKERGVEMVSGMDKPSAISVDENNITEFPWGRTAFFKDSEGNELAVIQDFK